MAFYFKYKTILKTYILIAHYDEKVCVTFTWK